MRQLDALLLPFVQEKNEATAEFLLAQLISEHAEAIIKGIIRVKLRASLKATDGSHQNQDALEVNSDVHVLLITELRSLKSDPDGKAISNFRSYVAVITYHACSKYLRQKYPRRWRLKNRLRYLLTHRPEFALWERDEKELLCGLATWRAERTDFARAERLQQLQDNPQAFMQARLPNGEASEIAPPADSLTAIFKWLGCPIELDDLVNILADWWGIRELTPPRERDEEEHDDLAERLPDLRASVADELDQRLYLQHLWTEICQLPERQRAAILLNLRDAHGLSCLALLPLTGIATIRQIAKALDVPAEQFATLWNNLPLDDASIAEHLGLTRQQVINLRKAGRERLARRMG